MDKSELVRDDNKKNIMYRKNFGSETICTLDRINDYFNTYDKYTIKFYFSNILPLEKNTFMEDDIISKEKEEKKLLINKNGLEGNSKFASFHKYEFDPENPNIINRNVKKDIGFYREK